MFVYFKQKSTQTWLKCRPRGSCVQPAAGSAEPLRFAPGSSEDWTHRLLPQCPLRPGHLFPPSLSHLSLQVRRCLLLRHLIYEAHSLRNLPYAKDRLTRSICPTGMLTTLQAWSLLWRHRAFWTESCRSANVFQWKTGAKWQCVRCPPGRLHRCAMLNSVPQGFGLRTQYSTKDKRWQNAENDIEFY